MPRGAGKETPIDGTAITRVRRQRKPTRAAGPVRSIDALVRGDIDMSTLDDEEIMRGRLRDSRGNFTGVASSLIPRAFHDQLRAEFYKRANGLFDGKLYEAIRVFGNVVSDPTADTAVRLRAAQYIIERVMGKPAETVNINAQVKPWEEEVRGPVSPDLSGLSSFLADAPDDVRAAVIDHDDD